MIMRSGCILMLLALALAMAVADSEFDSGFASRRLLLRSGYLRTVGSFVMVNRAGSDEELGEAPAPSGLASLVMASDDNAEISNVLPQPQSTDEALLAGLNVSGVQRASCGSEPGWLECLPLKNYCIPPFLFPERPCRSDRQVKVGHPKKTKGECGPKLVSEDDAVQACKDLGMDKCTDDTISPRGVFIPDAGHQALMYQRPGNRALNQRMGLNPHDYLANGKYASTGYCLAWDALPVINGNADTMYPPASALVAPGMKRMWKPTFAYGMRSRGGKIFSTRTHIRKLSHTAAYDKAMLIHKRTVCEKNGNEAWTCNVMKMAQCYRCTNPKYMVQEKSKVFDYHTNKYAEVGPQRVMFAGKLWDSKRREYYKRTTLQIQKEKWNFVQCAKELMLLDELPEANKCSFYCAETRQDLQNFKELGYPNGVLCSSLPDGKKSIRYTATSPTDDLLVANQVRMF